MVVVAAGQKHAQAVTRGEVRRLVQEFAEQAGVLRDGHEHAGADDLERFDTSKSRRVSGAEGGHALEEGTVRVARGDGVAQRGIVNCVAGPRGESVPKAVQLGAIVDLAGAIGQVQQIDECEGWHSRALARRAAARAVSGTG